MISHKDTMHGLDTPPPRRKTVKERFKSSAKPIPTKQMKVVIDDESDTESQDSDSPEAIYIKRREEQEIEDSSCCSCWLKFQKITRSVVINKVFNYTILSLVMCDTVVVLSEIMIGSYGLKHPSASIESTKDVLTDISMALLTIFTAEIPFRLIGLKLEFFKDKFEVFDSIIVLLSLFLSVFLSAGGAKEGVELLVILRLWRITRIANGLILSVKTRARVKRKDLMIRLDRLLSVNDALAKTATLLGEGVNCLTDANVDFHVDRDIVGDDRQVRNEVETAIDRKIGSCEACDAGFMVKNNQEEDIHAMKHTLSRYHTLKQKFMGKYLVNVLSLNNNSNDNVIEELEPSDDGLDNHARVNRGYNSN